MKTYIVNAINTVLSALFPLREPGRPSVFIQDTWLEKHSRFPFVQDWF